MLFCDEPVRLFDHKVVITQHRIFIKFVSISRGFFSFFWLVFRTFNIWSEVIYETFHISLHIHSSRAH